MKLIIENIAIKKNLKNFKTHKKNQNMSGGGGEAGETWFFVSFIAPW